jgi:hypothetical protein
MLLIASLASLVISVVIMRRLQGTAAVMPLISDRT